MSPRYETMVFDRAAWENPSRRVRPLWPIEQWPWTGERFDTAQESRDFHEATVDFFTRLQA